jgi:hypothetical protein
MKRYTLELPAWIDLPEEYTYKDITKEMIIEYFEYIDDYYGSFCNDCKKFDEDCGRCGSGFRPKLYNLVIGQFEDGYLRKKCKEFEMVDIEIDYDDIKRGISGALDCNIQQYC